MYMYMQDPTQPHSPQEKKDMTSVQAVTADLSTLGLHLANRTAFFNSTCENVHTCTDVGHNNCGHSTGVHVHYLLARGVTAT